MKYNPDTIDLICELLARDTFTIAEICERANITKVTYYEWIKTRPEFAVRVKEAEERRRASFAVYAEKSLLKKIQGYKLTDVTELVDKNGYTEKRTTTKEVAPDTTAIIFALTSLRPDVYKNRQTIDSKQEVEHKGTFKGFSAVFPEVDIIDMEKLEQKIQENRNEFYKRYADEKNIKQ